MIVFGVRLFGKSEVVPGVFFIATRFFHICFIPLIPMQSFVIADDGEAASLPALHWGSISMAWLRGLLLVGAVVLGVMGADKLEAHAAPGQARVMFLLALGCVAGFFGSYRLARANAQSLDGLRGIDGMPSSLLARAKQRLEGGG